MMHHVQRCYLHTIEVGGIICILQSLSSRAPRMSRDNVLHCKAGPPDSREDTCQFLFHYIAWQSGSGQTILIHSQGLQERKLGSCTLVAASQSTSPNRVSLIYWLSIIGWIEKLSALLLLLNFSQFWNQHVWVTARDLAVLSVLLFIFRV
jgi:hypothetical protein